MSDVLIDSEQLKRLQQLAALGELGAGISHETRNLVTSIVGLAQIARQRPEDTAASARYMAMIERDAMRCVRVLEDYLGLGRHDGQPALLDASTLLDHVAESTRLQAGVNRIRLRVDKPQVLAPVRASAGELQQIVLNLVLNAIHATPPGGEVFVTARADGGTLEITVADTGPGVPESLRERIFEPFFSTKPAGQGTGLGLAMCRRIAGELGGSVELDADTERGARFVVRIPVA